MLKKRNLLVLGFALVVILGAIWVYAESITITDTDGGFNIFQSGRCTEVHVFDDGTMELKSYTDYCSNDDLLVEYYPVTGGTQPGLPLERCEYYGWLQNTLTPGYSCSLGSNFMLKCSNGACVPRF